MPEARNAVADLRRIAFLLEAASEPTDRVRAFRNTAALVERMPPDQLSERARRGTLREIAGIGEVLARTIDIARSWARRDSRSRRRRDGRRW